uniref:Uncharacterized protein n=1 Tax=virus sp. ctQ5V6 TaxID=2825815 RepID=A0A8S5RQK2_9VIRU|nr:MAG TPA: hypothetical protein [virus sp. ctQ5V6]
MSAFEFHSKENSKDYVCYAVLLKFKGQTCMVCPYFMKER